jgi:hypothetical protein
MAKKKIKYIVEIPNFITEVAISQSRRAVYFKRGDEIPIKFLSDKYNFNEEDFLIDTKTNERVVANPRAAGKPRYHRVAGQDIWSNINYHLRSKIAKELKKYFYESLKSIPPLMDEDFYPIGIRIDIHDTIEGEDLDNQIYWYRKTMHDALCGNVEFSKDSNGNNIPDRKKYPPILIEDDKLHIQDIPTKFYAVPTRNDRKLVVEIYQL